VQFEMTGELGAVIEGDGAAQLWRHGAEQFDEMPSDAVRLLAGQPDREQEAGLALMHGQDRLAVF
jgi:hypothetical protein